MQYLLLIYADVSKRPNYTPEQLKAAQQTNTAYLTEAQAAGVLAKNESFHSISNVRTVRVRNDKTLTADGSFAVMEEQLTGYIILNCKDDDEAARWAAKSPAARYGSIEVRPVDAYSRS